MVTLPPPYVATKYPGYFWNVNTQTLYSLKVSGVLTELKHHKPNHWNGWWHYEKGRKGGYKVSVNGHRRSLFVVDLQELKIEDSVIPEA